MFASSFISAAATMVGCPTTTVVFVDEYPQCTDGTWVRDPSFPNEACHSFASQKEAVTDVANAPAFILPVAGANLSKTTPPEFSWTAGNLGAGEGGVVDAGGSADGGGTSGDGSTEPPYDGAGYVLVYRDATAGTELLRYFGTDVKWTPDSASWAKVTAVTDIRVTLIGMNFVGSNLPSPPITGQPRSFKIAQ